jgi:hypothetical protein
MFQAIEIDGEPHWDGEVGGPSQIEDGARLHICPVP